jgi:xanthine dehydrogenase YagT iron-sulfur-binding subunit
LLAALSSAESALVRVRPCAALTRRDALMVSLIAAFATLVPLVSSCKREPARATRGDAGARSYSLDVNEHAYALPYEPRVSLLDALRERLGLVGTKKGCDGGQCGACTVLIDGRRELACLTLAVTAEGKRVTTIEGMGSEGALHPLQQAFVDADGMQCGFCTPGQIMSAAGLLHEGHAVDDAAVREEMSGNVCRCGAYPHIVEAIQRARSRSSTR